MVELDRRMLRRGGRTSSPAASSSAWRWPGRWPGRPRLMLLDEPFSALDAGLRDNMRKAVAQLLRAAGITAILVTHDQAEALSFADQVAVLRAGRLAQVGPPRELYLQPQGPRHGGVPGRGHRAAGGAGRRLGRVRGSAASPPTRPGGAARPKSCCGPSRCG